MKKLIATVILVVSTSPAFAVGPRADDAAKYILEVKSGQLTYRSELVPLCADSIKEARATNTPIPPSPLFKDFGGTPSGNSYTITYDQADAICREASYYNDVVFKDLKLLSNIDWRIDTLVKIPPPIESKDQYDMTYMTELGESCEKAVAALTAAKVPPSTPFKLKTTGVETVGDLQKKLCDRAKDIGQNYWKQREAEAGKAKEPYIKAGIKGDKLDLMMEYDGSIFLTGKRAPDGIKPYAQASVMFTWSTSDADDAGYVVHSVTKYVFKGNNLAHTSSKSYRKRKGEDLGASAFK